MHKDNAARMYVYQWWINYSGIFTELRETNSEYAIEWLERHIGYMYEAKNITNITMALKGPSYPDTPPEPDALMSLVGLSDLEKIDYKDISNREYHSLCETAIRQMKASLSLAKYLK